MMNSKLVNLIVLNLLFLNSLLLPAVVTLSIPDAIPPADLMFEVGDLGKLKGISRKTVGDTKRDFVLFSGVPYASSSSGSYRFMPAEPLVTPLPVAPGKDYFDASSTACCIQYDSVYCSVEIKEDCLQLQVSTPLVQSQIDPENLLPVIVFIHGGSFSSGTYGLYNGERILENDVVFVSINYRLGVFGFFCLDTEEAPGNAAMYDVVQAINWVKKYIRHFGGNPDLITMTGQSAGSVTVTQLMVSPMARHENTSFHRAIAMSGSALNDWGTTTGSVARVASLAIAEIADCYHRDSPESDAEIVSCMQNVPPSTLLSALGTYQAKERIEGRLGFDPTTPTIQSVAPVGYEKFLDEHPLKVLEERRQLDIPLMMGSTRHDGSYVLGVVYGEVLTPNDLQNNATFLKYMAMPMLLAALGVDDSSGAIYDLLSDTYLGPEIKLSGNFSMMIPGIIDLFSVFFFKAAEVKTLSLHSRVRPENAYWYSFDFNGTRSLFEMQFGVIPIPPGVSHADDLIYISNIMTMSLSLESEYAVSKRVVDYWVNFAYNGNPNIEPSGNIDQEVWPSYTEDVPGYIVYNEDHTVVYDYPNKNWLGLSYELMPELFPPQEPTTTADPCSRY